MIRCDRRRALGLLGLAAAAPFETSAQATSAAPAPPPERFRELKATAARLPRLESLMVSYDGRIVLAESFRGRPFDQPVAVKSVSKSVVSALTGIAIDRGIIADSAATLGELIPALIPTRADPAVSAISVAQLLSMQSGLQRTSGPHYGTWIASPDWIKHILARPLLDEPGGRMRYSTGNYHILGAVLAEKSGQSLLALARDWLAAPLDIKVPPWTRDPQGYYLGGNEMALSPLALLRFGELYRNAGQWRGKRVLSERWVNASWEVRTRSPYSGHDYGYGWFLARVGADIVAYARGYGGQLIYVLPAARLTVVITSNPSLPARSGGYIDRLHDLFANVILPAVRSS